jgi:hypothetical protein
MTDEIVENVAPGGLPWPEQLKKTSENKHNTRQ